MRKHPEDHYSLTEDFERSAARDLAFHLIFERAFRDESMEEIIADAEEARAIEEDEFAMALTNCVNDHLAEIDAEIDRYSEKWKVNRLPKVSLTVLRLAIGEMLYFRDIPVAATINEAVELAKKYSMQEDAAYINGVLGAFAKANRTGDEQ